MPLHPDDTIAALASAAGPGARGVLRLSGPATRDVLDPLFEPDDRERWASAELAVPRRAQLFEPDDRERWASARLAERHTGRFWLRGLADASRQYGCVDRRGSNNVTHDAPLTTHPPLPVAVYLWPTHRSFTGQFAAEIHTVGSPPLLEAVLSELYANGVRPARPGEFTLRAFLAGRIDLVQAEAVLGVVDAHDYRELELALRQLAGGLSGRIAEVHSDLLNLLADLEAGLDFVDEDIEFVGRTEVLGRLGAAHEAIARLLDQATSRMQSTGRRLVVLAGLPNAGKSTLFNALVGREAALVSEVQGTTRDYLTAELDWNGTALELIDTAGWETGPAGLMQQAHALRNGLLERADLILLCNAADADETARTAAAQFRDEFDDRPDRVLNVATKSDLAGIVGLQDLPAVAVSARTRAGLNELVEAAAARLADTHAGNRQLLGTTAARGRESLEAALGSLNRACQAAEFGEGDEIVALEVRTALEQLGRILGAVYTDDILDRIFSRFCIGK